MSVSWIDAASKNFNASSKLNGLNGWLVSVNEMCLEEPGQYTCPDCGGPRPPLEAAARDLDRLMEWAERRRSPEYVTRHWFWTTSAKKKKGRTNHRLGGNPDFPVRRMRVRMQLSALPCARDDCEHSLPLFRKSRALQHAGLYLVEELFHAQQHRLTTQETVVKSEEIYVVMKRRPACCATRLQCTCP